MFQELRKNRVLFLMLAPALLYFIIFHYIPMPGAYIAFVDYNVIRGIFRSPFVGLRNFEFLVRNGDLLRITRNTVLYNVAFIVLGNFLQIFLAVALSEIGSRMYKKVTQSIILLPHFMSMVIVGVFAYNFFNYSNGFVNTLFVSMGLARYEFYSDPEIWKYFIVAFRFWSATGYGMIVYLAVITGISKELYEAAYIDGANEIKRIVFITIPMLKQTVILLILFGLGGILKGAFDLFYNLIGTNSILYPQTDIIDTYVFRSLVGSFNFSMGAAVGFYQSIFGLILVLTINLIIRKVEPESSLF